MGWKLEALHPVTRTTIVPATVTDVLDKHWFIVTLDDMLTDDDNERVMMCVNAASPEIFPVEWCQNHQLKLSPPAHWDAVLDFDWGEYLSECNAAAAPPNSFLMVRALGDIVRVFGDLVGNDGKCRFFSPDLSHITM